MKVVNSSELDNAIKVTADAIREKTGDTNKLTWSTNSGFADIIKDISVASNSDIGNIQCKLSLDLENLMLWHDFIYYDTIEQAIDDIMANTIGEKSTTDNTNSRVVIYIDEGVPHLVLLKSCNILSTINVTTDMVFVLNGHKLISNDVTAIKIQSNKVVIDGRVSGGKVDVLTSIPAQNISAIHLVGGNCIINGGEFNSLTLTAGTRANPNGMIIAESGTKLIIDNAKLLAKDNNGGAINSIFMHESSTLKATNCIIEADSKDGLSPDAIYSYGDIELISCNIVGKSNHVANSAGNDYGATSRGVNSQSGSVKVINCYVAGTHSGMTVKGNLYAEGCVFESYSHGGIYVATGGKNAYLSNCIIQQCKMFDGYISDTIAGTNNAGVYIGGASNINVYVDSCKFYGIQQPIVLRASSGEKNNHLYISNSYINLDYKNYGIRNDGTHYVYFGIGNNFGASNLRYKRNYEETEKDYSEFIPCETKTEIWTFEMVDGASITKEVIVK